MNHKWCINKCGRILTIEESEQGNKCERCKKKEQEKK
jgi:hypothetical protein